MDDVKSSDPAKQRRGWPLHTKILIGLVVGAATGLVVNMLAERQIVAPEQIAKAVGVADPLGRVFLRLIMMMVIPLVVSALSLGVLELGDVRRLGRVGLRTLVITLLLSGSAVAIGLTLVNWWQPGRSLPEAQRQKLVQQQAEKVDAAIKNVEEAKKKKNLGRMLLDIIPENPLQEAVGSLDGTSPGNGMLAVMFFALALGAALAVAGPRGEAVVRVLEGLFDVSMVVIGFAMRIAPYGVACLMFATTAVAGIDILKTLALFVVTALSGMTLQVVVVYSLTVWLIAGRRPLKFFRDISEAMLTAFGTSSSNATLPTALRVADQRLHLPKDISQFVLTIGSTANQNGTALYEGVVVLFLAQVYGVDLSLTDQVTVVLMSVLAGVGTAGIPGGSIPLIIVVLQSVRVPAEAIGIILGIDRILDMCRTVLNVSGDLVLAACVAGRNSKTKAVENAKG